MLFGNIMSMQCVNLVGAQRDVLLLSFWDAKVCEPAVGPYASCSTGTLGNTAEDSCFSPFCGVLLTVNEKGMTSGKVLN